MPAKIYSSPTEALALRSLCSKDNKISGLMLSRVGSDYFHTDEGKEVYEHIMGYFGKKGHPPSFKLMCDDVRLSEDSREFLRNADGVAKSTNQAEQVVDSLNNYRKTREYYKLARHILKHLDQSKVDLDKMQDDVAKRLSRIQLRRAGEAEIIRFGRNSNIKEVIEDILYNDESSKCIPTGFATFDDVNGGFFRGSLVMLGATSSGGKSLLANQLNMNQALLGYDTTLVPLEMSRDEMVSRTMSSASGYESIDIFLKRLEKEEKDNVYRKVMRFNKRIKKADGQYQIYKPKEDLTIEELMGALSAYKSDIIYIDYIGLLKGADGEDQWRRLGQIARYGKIFAEMHDKVVCMLAQVSDEGKIRYSQTIKEHASLAWTFVATKETKEKGYLNIEMPKSRNQVSRPFVLGVDYAKMKVFDLAKEELEAMAQDRSQNNDDSDRKDSKPGKYDKHHRHGKGEKSRKEKDKEKNAYAPDLSE